jgi:hypothetical protein
MVSPTLLELAVQDSNRRDSETAIRTPTDKLIFVEGKFDFFFFKDLSIDLKGISIQMIRNNGGKSAVIAKAKENESFFGIVDMDHDFFSEEFKTYCPNRKKFIEHSRITDTNSDSCLYSFITSEWSDDQIMSLYQTLVFSCCKHLQDAGEEVISIRGKILSELRSNFYDFNEYINERTIANLWRGYEGKVRDLSSTRIDQDWRNIHADGYTKVQDLIDVPFNEYEKWKLDFADELKLVGINDHRLIEGLLLLFKKFLPTFEQNQENINRRLENSLSTNLQKYRKKRHLKHFLDKLKLS